MENRQFIGSTLSTRDNNDSLQKRQEGGPAVSKVFLLG